MQDQRGARRTIAAPLFPGDDTTALLADAMERAQAARTAAAAAGDTALIAGLRSAIGALRNWRTGHAPEQRARPTDVGDTASSVT